jgi:hypothetical protein
MVGAIPDVPYHVFYFPASGMQDMCRYISGPEAMAPFGCSVEEKPGLWHIYIDNERRSLTQQFCTLWHERAHLPPLRWKHPPGNGWYLTEGGHIRPGPTGPNYRVHVH